MSKVDAQRAMREARYAAAQSRQPIAPRPAPPARVARTGPPDSALDVALEVSAESESLCGHRNMGGKSCQRMAGHAEKNHRYK